jgi:hypothetical protein
MDILLFFDRSQDKIIQTDVRRLVVNWPASMGIFSDDIPSTNIPYLNVLPAHHNHVRSLDEISYLMEQVLLDTQQLVLITLVAVILLLLHLLV